MDEKDYKDDKRDDDVKEDKGTENMDEKDYKDDKEGDDN